MSELYESKHSKLKAGLETEVTKFPNVQERIMRLLVASGFAEEVAHREYSPTEITHEMTQKSSIGISEAL